MLKQVLMLNQYMFTCALWNIDVQTLEDLYREFKPSLGT